MIRRDVRTLIKMARPSVASLNSLADVLRQAQPLYAECRSILNYLDNSDGTSSPSSDSEFVQVNTNGPPIYRNTFDQKGKGKNGLF